MFEKFSEYFYRQRANPLLKKQEYAKKLKENIQNLLLYKNIGQINKIAEIEKLIQQHRARYYGNKNGLTRREALQPINLHVRNLENIRQKLENYKITNKLKHFNTQLDNIKRTGTYLSKFKKYRTLENMNEKAEHTRHGKTVKLNNESKFNQSKLNQYKEYERQVESIINAYKKDLLTQVKNGNLSNYDSLVKKYEKNLVTLSEKLPQELINLAKKRKNWYNHRPMTYGERIG